MAEGNGEGQATGAHIGTSDVFISYASQDSGLAEAVVAALERDGLKCWIAPRDVTPGEFYGGAIVHAIDAAKATVLILSQHSAASPHVVREVERAASKRRPVISLRIDQAPLPADLEYFLNSSHWLDATEGDSARAMSKLVDAVKRLMASEAVVAPGYLSGVAKRAANPLLPHIGGTRATRRASRPVVVLGVLIAVLVAYLGVDRLWLSKRGASEKPAIAAPPVVASFNPPPHSIAVLPFVNMSDDAKQDYFADGISEELLNALARLNELQVTARTSSFSFRGQNVDVSTIAHRLNVRTVLEGSVRRAGNTVRIAVQLINADNGFHMWSQTYDRELTDILKVQTDVATAVAQQLEIKLSADFADKLAAGGTRNADAYDAYLRGEQLLFAAGDTNEESIRSALAEFDQAIAFDPKFSLAHAGRAIALGELQWGSSNFDARERLRQQGLTAAEQAVALAPELGEAHLAIATNRAFGWPDMARAAPEFEIALALAPGNAHVQRGYGTFSAMLGRHDQALKAALRAVTLDPRDVSVHAELGHVLLIARRYDAAAAAYRDASILSPNSHYVAAGLTNVLLASGQFELARHRCESVAAPLDQDYRYHCLALAYHLSGRQSDAEHELEKLKTQEGDSAAYVYAQIYAQWGDRVSALEWLRKAERFHDPDFSEFNVDWQLDPIRNEPQFKAIQARMNFPP